MTSHFSDMTSSSIFWRCFVSLVKFSYWSKFHVISSLVLESWQFSFIRDWLEIWKSEIPPFEFWSVSGDCGELGIPKLAQMFLIKWNWMLQNARVMAFAIFELISESKITPPPKPRHSQIRVKFEAPNRKYTWKILVTLTDECAFVKEVTSATSI